MRLIDVDKLKSELSWLYDYDYVTTMKAIGIVNSAPIVDVEPVRHGKWIPYSSTMMECSVCKRHTARHKYEYCPRCGAKMG